MLNNKSMTKAIEDHFKDQIPKDIEKLARLMYWDLVFGPLTGCDECGVDYLDDCTCEIKYPGFTSATNTVSEWISENVHTLYFEEWSGCVSSTLPTYEDEEGNVSEGEDVYILEKRDIVRMLFSKEIVEYVT